MPIIAVPMTPDSYNHAREIVDFAVSVTTGPPPTTTINTHVRTLIDALHQIVAGATVTGDATDPATRIRTITIDTNRVAASKKTDLDNMLTLCLNSITVIEMQAPGVILKV
jgi:hypothetical protein